LVIIFQIFLSSTDLGRERLKNLVSRREIFMGYANHVWEVGFWMDFSLEKHRYLRYL
jgi:hypothetical protein